MLTAIRVALLRPASALPRWRPRFLLAMATAWVQVPGRGHEGVSQPYCPICVYILSRSQLKYHRVPMRRRLAIHSLVIRTTLRPA